MSKVKNEKDAKSFYTKRTLELIAELEKLSPESADSGGANTPNSFTKNDVKGDVVEENIDGDSATLTVKVVSSSGGAPEGYVHTMKMKKEDGEWKLDMEYELETAAKMLKSANQLTKGMEGAMQSLGNLFKGGSK